MKRLLIFIVSMTVVQARAQLLVNIQLPPSGVMQKPQLWNMAITNTSANTLSINIELTFSDDVNAIDIMNASTQLISIPPGTTQLNDALLQAIQYNVFSQAYAIDASPTGLLPVGDFEVCYSFMSHTTDAIEKIAEQCQELLVEPLSPPQLIFPYDQSIVDTKNPILSWLPPLPVNLFSNLNYNLDLVEVSENQAPEDAIEQNVPILHQEGITGNTLLYPTSAQALELNNQYAWRVIAKTNQTKVGQSDTWIFSYKDLIKKDTNLFTELSFAKLKKGDNGGYAIFVNELKFDYLNENSDSAGNLNLYDLSTTKKKQLHINMDSIVLVPGQNLVQYNATNNPDFIDKHLYLLEVINSRNESWKLRFEYRKPQE